MLGSNGESRTSAARTEQPSIFSWLIRALLTFFGSLSHLVPGSIHLPISSRIFLLSSLQIHDLQTQLNAARSFKCLSQFSLLFSTAKKGNKSLYSALFCTRVFVPIFANLLCKYTCVYMHIYTHYIMYIYTNIYTLYIVYSMYSIYSV